MATLAAMKKSPLHAKPPPRPQPRKLKETTVKETVAAESTARSKMQHSTFMEEHRKLLLKNEDLMAWKSPRLRDPTPPPPMTLTATNATTAAVDPPPTPDPPAEVAAGPGLENSESF